MNTNIATPVTYSKDQLFRFAESAIVGQGMVKASSGGLSEQLWVGLRADNARTEAFADDIRDSFDEHVVSLGKSALAKKLSGWKKGSPLAQRLSECRRVCKFATEHPDKAGEVWAIDTLKLALKFVRENSLKPDKPKAPAAVVETQAVVEADADAGAELLADLRAYLNAASENDRLAMIVELEAIVTASVG